jgi:hypothetical protein
MTNAEPVTDRRRVLVTRLLGVWLGLVVVAAPSQSATHARYAEVFDLSGGLRIQAYLYTPDGDAPFPNDRTTASITTMVDIFQRRGVPHRWSSTRRLRRGRGGRATAPGHRVVSDEGTGVWARDVLEFLGRYLGATSKRTPIGGPGPATSP